MNLPKRVFNSPALMGINFENGTFVNLIRLNKPYSNGASYAVHQTTKSAFCSSGLFKTYVGAKRSFDRMGANGSCASPIAKVWVAENFIDEPDITPFSTLTKINASPVFQNP